MLEEVGKEGEGQSQSGTRSLSACFCLAGRIPSSLSRPTTKVWKLDGALDGTEQMIGQKLEMESA